MARNEKNSACDFFSHSWNFDAISCKKMREYREIAPENDPCIRYILSAENRSDQLSSQKLSPEVDWTGADGTNKRHEVTRNECQ